MNLRKRINEIKNYPVIWGILLIFIIMCIILAIKLDERYRSAEPTVVTGDMTREATVEGFGAGSDVVKYFLSAVQEKDLDKAMRAFPLDELVLNADYGKIIEMSGEFSSETIPPSSQYSQYAPLTASELAGQYVEVYEHIEGMFDWENASVISVDLLLPDQQKEDNFKINASERCDALGSDALCELAAQIQAGDDIYLLPVTVVRYDSSWKVLGAETQLLENYSGEAVQMEDEEYQTLVSKDSAGIWEDLNSEEEAVEEWEFSKAPEEQLLPANYFLANQIYTDEPKKAISDFTVYLQKEDLTAALCYGDLKYENIDTETAVALSGQKDFAQQIAKVYYEMIFNRTTDEKQSLKSLGMTGNQIVKALDPEYVPFMDLIKTVSLGDDEYAAVYYYGREHYLVGFTMEETDMGWQISSLSSAKAGLPDGGVKKITEKEYNSLKDLD